MSIIYIEGSVDVNQFEEHSGKAGFEPQKVVFLFPGNKGHHSTGTTLFSIKTGGGLALAAANLGRKGYPTLSLPTTNMEKWESDQQIKETVDGAIADLYRALGAGFQLMLPVREHKNTNYFDEALENLTDKEPSFWGGIESASNKPLANYYSNQLNILNRFLALPKKDRANDHDNAFMKYYLEGKQMAIENHPWIQPAKCQTQSAERRSNPRVAAETNDEADLNPVSDVRDTPLKRPVAVSNTPSISQKIPAAYERLYNSHFDSPLAKARELLADYTKDNSVILRFFHAHWGRHHVREVNALVQEIDNNKIGNVVILLEKLHRINLINSKGSLARRIAFIEKKNRESELMHSPDLSV